MTFKPTRLITHTLLAVILVAPSIFAANSQASASTILDSEPNPAVYLYARWVDAIVKCAGDVDEDGKSSLKPTLGKSEYNSMLIFRDGKGNDGRVVVGHDLEYSGGISGDDGVASCNELIIPGMYAINQVFGSTGAFLDNLYTKGTYSDDVYILKDSGSLIAPGVKKYVDDLLKTKFISANNTGDIRKSRLAVAFSECFKESSGSDNDTPGLSANYVYVNGKSSGSSIKVGLGDPGGPSESLDCSTLANLAKPSNEDLIAFMSKYNVTTGVLRNNPQNIYANIMSGSLSEQLVSNIRPGIVTALNASSDIVKYCLSSAKLPQTISADSLADWLVSGNYKDNLTYTEAGKSKSATEDEAAGLKACLLDKGHSLGQFLTATLATLNQGLETIDSARQDSSGSSSESGTVDSDVCLSKGDNFISWLACPVINLIDSFFATLRNTLQEMLKFSIEDSGDGTASNLNELKASWNIFRGIASILIIIFFLTALLVKSIRGE